MFNLSVTLKQDFIELIAEHTGIKMRSVDQGTLDEKIFTRMKALNFSACEDYYNFLKSITENNQNEWEKLVVLLTNLESYFFRDKGQFTLLRNVIIPELVRRNNRRKILKICSAGCSTGQEPYSIAILLREIIPDIDRWQILILGLDINKEALKIARKGSYNNWSFRSVEDRIKNKYFTFTHHQYNLIDDIKKMVEFKYCNLVDDLLSKNIPNAQDIDLIICRNVFIYFEPEAINKVINKFYDILNPNGYLITGHAEVIGKQIKRFEAKTFPESIVYQRPQVDKSDSISLLPKQDFLPEPKPLFEYPVKTNLSNTFNINNSQNQLINTNYKPILLEINDNVNPPVIEENITKSEPIKSVISSQKLLEEAERLFTQKLYKQALEKIDTFLGKNESENLKAYELTAQIYANQGQYNKALEYCEKALKINSFAINPHYILSHIAQEKGNQNEAKNLLKKIIYLEPNFLPAYLELSYIYEQEGDTSRQLKMEQDAINLLRKLPLNTKLPDFGDFTVQELIEKLEKKV